MLKTRGRSIACIDPGLHAGLAIWDSRAWNKKNQCPKIQSCLQSTARTHTYHRRADEQLSDLMTLLSNHDVAYVFCELPERFEGQRAAAAEAKGSILKLTYWVGQLAGRCYSQKILFFRVPVRLWKGTLSKELTTKRIRRIAASNGWLERLKTQPDILDAVGIGLFLQRNGKATDEVCKS